MVPITMHLSAALLVGLLGPAAAIQSAADEKTVLTGFDLGQFMSGFMHGATGSDAGDLGQCSQLMVDLTSLKGSVAEMQNVGTMLQGFKELFSVFKSAGAEFQGCKNGFVETLMEAKEMFSHRPAISSLVSGPLMHFTQVMKLAGLAAGALKGGSFKEAGEDMGKILSVSGLVDSAGASSEPKALAKDQGVAGATGEAPAGASSKKKGLFGLFR